MVWPAAAVTTTNTDAGTDNPATARSDLLDLMTKFNQMRSHVTAFMQTFLSRSDAAGARGDLGLANHQLVTVTAGGATSQAGGATLGGGLTVQAGGASITGATNVTGAITATTNITATGSLNGASAAVSGNMTAGGSITATGNVTAYSDERLKADWQDLDPDFIERLAAVRAGTYELDGEKTRRFAGVSAQSLRAVLPEVVEMQEDGYLTVAYGNAALVAAIHLAREVTRLRAEIEELKAQK